MKLLFPLLILFVTHAIAQQNENASQQFQQQLENQAERDDNETEDDSYLQYLEHRRRHKLNLNKATEDELLETNLLTDLQVQNLFRYRQLFGNLINIYELQAIPGWDIATIRSLLPFVSINGDTEIPGGWKNWFRKGESRLLLRFSQVVEKAKGFIKSDSGKHYAGSPSKLLFRYKYQYRDILQYGITGDKDAGEQFFKGKQKQGFDFYSFHFFLRRIGIFKGIAIGDFVINLGQGLIHWQGQAFKKSAVVLNIKRQAAVLKPYTAAGEYNFHRGGAITLQYKNWQSTLFASSRKWDAALQVDEQMNEYVSSIQLSGFHRTKTELANKNRVKAFVTGTNIKYRGSRGHIGINTVYHSFNIPFNTNGDPYDLYAISGRNWGNLSVDYSYTYANYHIYGELASDEKGHIAMLHGMLISAGPSLDMAMVYRGISAAYQSVAGNAFTENGQPANENGFYASISFRPVYGWRLDAYMDYYRFPWLKFRVDAPSTGSDYLLQVTCTPNKQTEIYTRFRIETKGLNQPTGEASMPAVEQVLRKNWRSQVSCQITKEWSLQNRVEVLWYKTNYTLSKKTGFLCFQDIQYAPAGERWKASLRVQYFEADDYDTRLYAFENSVLYSFSMPAFFNKGLRWNASFQYKAAIKKKGIACIAGLNLSRSSFETGTVIGSGQDQMPGSKKTEIRAQVVFTRQRS